MPGGRPKGSPNKATKDIKAMAAKYAPQALETLVDALNKKNPGAVRVAASIALLDRGFGKPAQIAEHTGEVRHVISRTPMTEEQWAREHVGQDAHGMGAAIGTAAKPH